MDGIGSYAFNKLAKFIEGDDPAPIPEEIQVPNEKPTVSLGPFSHYSEISSATTSQLPSPTSSVKGSNSYTETGIASIPPRRSGSAMSFRGTLSPSANGGPPDRSASAMDHSRPQMNPPPTTGMRHYSAGPGTTSFPHTDSSESLNTGNRGPSAPAVLIPSGPPAPSSSYSGGWWQASGEEDQNMESEATPTATAFDSSSDDVGESGNFISLMDTYSPTMTPVTTTPSSR